MYVERKGLREEEHSELKALTGAHEAFVYRGQQRSAGRIPPAEEERQVIASL